MTIQIASYNIAIVGLETAIGPIGSESSEYDNSDAEIESAIGPIESEALEYDNYDTEVATKKKTKR